MRARVRADGFAPWRGEPSFSRDRDRGGAGLSGNDSPGAAGGGRESRVREWTLGKSRVVTARLPPEPPGEETSLRLRSVDAVGVRRFHSNFGAFKLWGVFGSGVSEGVTNQSPGTGINYANHHLAMGQMTPNTFKKYLAGSSLDDSGEPWLPGQAARERADLVLVQDPSHSPHHPAAEFSRVFIFHLLHLQLRPPLSLVERGLPTGGLTGLDRWKLREVFFVFLKVPFWRRGCGEVVRMRNTILQLCLWSAYCCFAMRDPTPLGPEGRLQGNVDLFYYHPRNFFSGPGALSLAHPSSCSILLAFRLRCPLAPPN